MDCSKFCKLAPERDGEERKREKEEEEEENGSFDLDRKSKMSFSYWGADKITIHKPAVKP